MSLYFLEATFHADSLASSNDRGNRFLGSVVEETVIHFIAKTWFLWWALADVLILLWFHALTASKPIEQMDSLATEEEAAYVASWRLLRRGRPVSFSLLGTER